MPEAQKRISFDEFSANLTRIFDRVSGAGEEIIVETKAGALVTLKALTRARLRRRRKTKTDYEAFLASAGGWQDVDVERFLQENAASRHRSTRPQVNL